MSRYVAFLRGINVGGRVVKMDMLLQCFEGIGLSDVKTYLQTGNVYFEADNAKKGDIQLTIEQALSEAFGYDAKIQLIEFNELLQIIDQYPFAIDEPDMHNYVIFIDQALIAELAIPEITSTDERISAGNHAVYWQVPRGMTLKSEFAKVLQKPRFREHNTVRNINTLRKILADNT